jgi:sorbitol-specific phosphotransferase system component IIA
MKFLKLILIVPILMLAYAFMPVSSGNDVLDNWRELGRVKAGHNGDHDRINIDGPHDTYRKLKFRVENSALNMSKMVVVYDDGAPENIEVKNEIAKGGESRAIDLKGGKRKLKSVEFWFDTKGVLNGKAEVILYGSK